MSLRNSSSRAGAKVAALVFSTFLGAGLPIPAFAQAAPSAADAATARALFAQGVKVQESGKPGEALDIFRRADRIYPAPTILLHLAECQAAVGQLVESSETYHRLANFPLEANASAPSKAAQAQGKSEMEAVDLRVPMLKVDVTPGNVDGLEVQVDGTTMNSAAIGLGRAINPGEHRVTATAPGYNAAEQSVSVPERRKDIAVLLTLTPAPGGRPSVAPPPPGGIVPPPPPPLEVNGAYAARPEDSRFGWLLGGRLGVDFVGGSLDGPTSIKKNVGVGGSVGIEGGVRFARRLYLGAVFEYAGYTGGSPDAGSFRSGDQVSQSANSEYFGLDFGFMSHPTSVAGLYAEAGVGYRLLNYSATDTYGDVNDSFNFGGVEGQLGLGMTLRAGKTLLFIPKVDVNVGSFSVLSSSCAASGCVTLAQTTDANPFHAVVLVALGVYFDKDY